MTGLRDTFVSRREKVLMPLANGINKYLKALFESFPRIDRISARAKSVERFLAKAAKFQGGKPKYDDPLNEIQDQVGARIVTFYPSDVERVRQRADEAMYDTKRMARRQHARHPRVTERT